MTMSVTVKGCGNADGMTSITGHQASEVLRGLCRLCWGYRGGDGSVLWEDEGGGFEGSWDRGDRPRSGQLHALRMVVWSGLTLEFLGFPGFGFLLAGLKMPQSCAETINCIECVAAKTAYRSSTNGGVDANAWRAVSSRCAEVGRAR
jgi:hypothetical protein